MLPSTHSLEQAKRRGNRAEQGRFTAPHIRSRETSEAERDQRKAARIPMADLPLIIVLALGGAAAGGPEALFLLIAVAGQSPAADIIIVVFLIFAVTAVLLGNMLLARFIRFPVANDVAAPPLAPGTERFAKVTLAVALAVVVFVSTCLLAIPAELGGEARSCSA